MTQPWDDPDLVEIERAEIEDDLAAQGLDVTYDEVASTFGLYEEQESRFDESAYEPPRADVD